MGQHSSRNSIASSVGNKFRKRYRRRGHSDLSAAFNIIDVDLHYEQLNINTATEEELMTLPSISRTIARNIIEYRNTIGSFRKVEDLALVSGVGATKLEFIRPEICVNAKRRSNLSQTSSVNPSLESIPSSVASNSGRSSRVACVKLVNVNKANVFQLMSVRGIDQTIAANIVHYREKKGPFANLDNLRKVKGLSHQLAADLRQYLTADPDSGPVEYIPRTPQRTPQNAHRPLSSSHRRTRSMPPKCEVPFPPFDTSDLFELLSSKSRRPVYDDGFGFRRNGRPALRLATWNLQQFVPEKADNPGVREVICRTILENGLSLIALQELGDREVMEKICAELNNPCLRRVQEWRSERGSWEYVTSDMVGKMQQECLEYSGFMYDTSRGLELKDSGLLLSPVTEENGSVLKKPFWARFTIEKMEFVAVCIRVELTDKHGGGGGGTTPATAASEAPKIAELLQAAELLQSSDNLIILGDTNLSPNEQEFNSLRERKFTHIVPVGTYTSSNTRSVNGSRGFDNIWISKPIYKFFTGHWGVVRLGLSHLAIPLGWTWGGSVSDHCPVWAEFYAQMTTTSAHDLTLPVVVANGRIKEEAEDSATTPY